MIKIHLSFVTFACSQSFVFLLTCELFFELMRNNLCPWASTANKDALNSPENNQFIFWKTSTPGEKLPTNNDPVSIRVPGPPLCGTVCRCVQVVTADHDLLTHSPLRQQRFNNFPVQPVSVSPVSTLHHCSSRHLVPQPSHHSPPVAPEHWILLIASPSKLYLLIGSLLWTFPPQNSNKKNREDSTNATSNNGNMVFRTSRSRNDIYGWNVKYVNLKYSLWIQNSQ